MLYYVVLCCTVLYCTVLHITLIKFYRLIRKHIRHYTGYIQDIRIDEYFRKATIIGELQSWEKETTPEQRVNKAYERSAAIVTDVLLQNGYDPRQYNLKGLVLVHRIQLGMQPVPGAIDRSVKPS